MKYLFGEFELNPATRELRRNGQSVALRPRSLECLIYLIEHRDRAVGRDELVAAVWGKVDAGDTVVAQTLLRARKALEMVDLTPRMHHKPNELSGGQRQRVAIARALVMGPSILLADEPTGNLDSTTGEEIMRVFEKLHQDGNTIILVTHEHDIAEHAHRVLKIRDGRVESDERR